MLSNDGAGGSGADFTDLARQLRRRRDAANRCKPFPCGRHRDPLDHPGPLDFSARGLAAWRAARAHLASWGLPAILPARIAELIDEVPLDEDAA